MPANDGTKQTWYSLLQSPAPGLLRISTRRLSYAASATAAKWRPPVCAVDMSVR